MGFENVGKVWTPAGLKEYLATINKPDWCKAVTLHHTAAPSLAQRPDGLILQHIRNIAGFYQNEKGWSSSPHLFVDDDQLWGMCDFRKKGIHAVSYNSNSIGIEVLGDYDVESPKSGRGLACWKMAAAATKVLLEWIGEPASPGTVFFHRDDPKTNKSCPGKKVQKEWFLNLLAAAPLTPEDTAHAKPILDITLAASDWRFVGEHWCVHARMFLLKKGVSEPDIKTNLKQTDGFFYYGTELLEDAFYDKETSATWAPVRELVELV